MERNDGKDVTRRVNVAEQRAQPTEHYNNRIGIVVVIRRVPSQSGQRADGEGFECSNELSHHRPE